MKPLRPTLDRPRFHPLPLLLAVNAAGLVLVALWFRCRLLGNIPGINGDEAWYGVRALQILRGEELCLLTPTRNPVNPFFLGPLVLLHAWFRPSITLLRWLALGSGVAAVAINWTFCRWVFDRRTATISTVLLAVLPINIAYSRFAWDASQSVAATLPVLYFSLAAVRLQGQRGRLLLAAVLAQAAAVLVHPTNIFASAAIAAALAVIRPWQGVKSLGQTGAVGRSRMAGLALAGILLLVLAAAWMVTAGPSRFFSRMGGVRELARTPAVSRFAVLYPRLFTGGTVYRYIAGSRSWLEWPCGQGQQGWGIDVLLFWLLVGAAAGILWRSWKTDGRMEDRVLILAWTLGLVAFLLLAGPRALVPGQERWAMCLVGPAVVLAARGLGLCLEAGRQKWRFGLAAAVSLVGWLLLADYQAHYFDFIRQTGGRAHRTFRTAAVEPKRAALRIILEHRGAGVAWIVADQWWDYWPLRYLGMAEEGIRVVTPAEAKASTEFELARRQGRVWYVGFAGSDSLEESRATITGRRVQRWELADYSGHTILCLLHPVAEVAQPRRAGIPRLPRRGRHNQPDCFACSTTPRPIGRAPVGRAPVGRAPLGRTLSCPADGKFDRGTGAP